MTIKERTEETKKSMENKNCIGTALFLAGVIHADVYLDPLGAERHLEDMEILNEPELNSLAVFRARSNAINHMGVVIDINPIRMIHRETYERPIIESGIEEYLTPILKLEYRRPNILSD